MIKDILFILIAIVIWILLFRLTRAITSFESYGEKARTYFIMFGNSIVFTLSLITLFYRMFTIIYCIPIWICILPMIAGDIYYSRKRVKKSMKPYEESHERLKEVLKKSKVIR